MQVRHHSTILIRLQKRSIRDGQQVVILDLVVIIIAYKCHTNINDWWVLHIIQLSTPYLQRTQCLFAQMMTEIRQRRLWQLI